MLDQVIFCNDGKLRLTGFMRQALPLELLQKDFAEKTGRKDDFYILRHLDTPVRIEEGTTLSHIMFAIEPWADLFGSYLRKDVQAYIEEFKKEIEVASESVVKAESWIGISRAIRFSIGYKEEETSKSERKSLRRSSGFIASLKHEKRYTTEPEDQFEMEDALCAARYIKGEENHYGLSYKPEYRDLLVFIDNEVKLHQFIKNEPELKDEMFLINNSAHSIKKTEYGKVISIEENTLGGLTLAEVLKAIFIFGFCAYSPADAEYQTSLIINSIEIHEAEKNGLEPPERIVEDWHEREIKAISAIKDRVAPHDKRVITSENLKLAKTPEKRLYNKII